VSTGGHPRSGRRAICQGLDLVNAACNVCHLGDNRITTKAVKVPPCFPHTGWRCQMVHDISSKGDFGASFDAPNHCGI
jgi:hypothetical protein